MRKFFYVGGMIAALTLVMVHMTSGSTVKNNVSTATPAGTISIEEIHRKSGVEKLPTETFDAF